MHRSVWWLICFVFCLILQRALQRSIATKRIYGWLPAFFSIPRALYGNFLNLHALLRAYRIYITAPKKRSRKVLAWDKTDHQFPDVYAQHSSLCQPLLQCLSSQYQMPLVPKSKLATIPFFSDLDLNLATLEWLSHHATIIVNFEKAEQRITLAILDPTRDLFLQQLRYQLKPYHVQFVLVDPHS